MGHDRAAFAAGALAVRALARPALRLRAALRAGLRSLPRRGPGDPLRTAESALPDPDPGARRAALRRDAATRLRTPARAARLRRVLAVGDARDRRALPREPAPACARHLPRDPLPDLESLALHRAEL